jgi:hypothetical protein
VFSLRVIWHMVNSELAGLVLIEETSKKEWGVRNLTEVDFIEVFRQ